MGYDKHLFLLQPQSVDLTGLTPFYRSVLQAWWVLTPKRNTVSTPGTWIFEEPLLGNNFIDSPILASASLRSKLREAGVVKLGHLLKTPVPQLAELLSIRSHRLLLRLVEQARAALPGALRAFAVDSLDRWDNCEYVFPCLKVCPAVGQWRPEDCGLLDWGKSVEVD